MSVVYSPLCDTDRSAYIAYCAASYGASFVKHVRCSGRAADAGRDGGDVDDGVDFALDAAGGIGPWSAWIAAVDGNRVAGGGGGGGCGGVGERGSLEGDKRVAVGGDGGVGRGDGRGDSDANPGVGVADTDGAEDAKMGQVEGVSARGPNYVRNKESRDRRKARKKRKQMEASSWRPVSQATVRPFESSPPPSLTGTVQTVTTELAEELEAKRTLASRRVAENRVAEALANHKLQSMLDPDKTKAVANLDAARVEQRINEAKAKAQAAFLKCSDAVTSLGSAGSAGEYVLKKEVKKGQIYQKKYEDAHAQMQEMMKYLSNEAKAKMAQWPAVKVPTYGEMFGDCPAHFNDEQAEAYYRDLANLDEEHVFASEVLF